MSSKRNLIFYIIIFSILLFIITIFVGFRQISHFSSSSVQQLKGNDDDDDKKSSTNHIKQDIQHQYQQQQQQQQQHHHELISELCGFSSGNNNKNIRISCIGDSITAGNMSHMLIDYESRHNAADDDNNNNNNNVDKKKRKKNKMHLKKGGNFPLTLEQLFLAKRRKKNHDNNGDVICKNFGVNGATISTIKKKYNYMKHPEYQQALEFTHDIILLMLGTNDCKTTVYRGEETFRKDFLNLLNSIQNYFLLRKKKQYQQQQQVLPLIFVATPPPIAGTNEALEWKFNPELLENIIAQMRLIVRNFGKQHQNVKLLELHDEFGKCVASSSQNEIVENKDSSSSSCSILGDHSSTSSSSYSRSIFDLFRDGIHPKRRTHDFIAQVIANKICESLW